MIKPKYLFVFLIAILFFACEEDRINVDFEYSIPEQVIDGWETDSLANVALDVTNISQMMNYINSTS